MKPIIPVLALLLATSQAHAVEKLGQQRLFGQCSALVLKGKSQACQSINLSHNDDGRSYYEIPTDDSIIVIGGQRLILGNTFTLEVDSIDPGTGQGETAQGDCQMQTGPTPNTLASLTCKATGSQTGQILFIFKPSQQKIDGLMPIR